jgi:hypothetical protein
MVRPRRFELLTYSFGGCMPSVSRCTSSSQGTKNRVSHKFSSKRRRRMTCSVCRVNSYFWTQKSPPKRADPRPQSLGRRSQDAEYYSTRGPDWTQQTARPYALGPSSRLQFLISSIYLQTLLGSSHTSSAWVGFYDANPVDSFRDSSGQVRYPRRGDGSVSHGLRPAVCASCSVFPP